MVTTQNSKKACIIIPARLDSKRLPQKVLRPIGPQSMLQWCIKQAIASGVGPVFVATDAPSIAQDICHLECQTVRSKKMHISGTDRVAEALSIVDPHRTFELVINLQADLPFLPPKCLKDLYRAFMDQHADLLTLAYPIQDRTSISSESLVKIAGEIIKQNRLRCYYFSRSVIPHGEGDHYAHIGLYGYQREALERFVQHPPTPLELREQLEQLRALRLGLRVDSVLVDQPIRSVDTEDDLEVVRKEYELISRSEMIDSPA